MILFIFILFIELVQSYNVVLNIGSTGLLLPYSIGIIGYIKKNININKYELIGTSGGAYCSLLYHYENDLTNHDYIWKNIFGLNETSQIDLYNLNKFQINSRTNLINRYKNEKCYDIPIKIIVTKYNNIINKKKIIFNNYNDIDDLIYKCYCSSYIPYISGNNIYYLYNNIKYYDGAFNKRDEMYNKIYINNNEIINDFDNLKDKLLININCNSWGQKWNLGTRHSLDIKKSRLLYKKGWDDTEKYIHKLLNKK